MLCGVIVSQIISNVPAAMLLRGFSDNYEAIIVGINIGGFRIYLRCQKYIFFVYFTILRLSADAVGFDINILTDGLVA